MHHTCTVPYVFCAVPSYQPLAALFQLGTLVFGAIMQPLLDHLGWRYTLLVNAGICLVVGGLAGSLFSPLPKRTEAGGADEHARGKSGGKVAPGRKRKNRPAMVPSLVKPSTGKKPPAADDDSDSSVDAIDEATLLRASPSMKRLYYGTGSPHSSISVRSDDAVTFTAPAQQQGCYCCCCGPCNSPFCAIVGETFDPSLFKNPIFVIFAMVLVLFSFGYHTPYTYVPERAIELGVSPRHASLLISLMGVSNVAARLIFGWIADHSEGIRFYFAGIVFVLGGAATICAFFYVTYPLMAAFSVVFGACSGRRASTCSPVYHVVIIL